MTQTGLCCDIQIMFYFYGLLDSFSLSIAIKNSSAKFIWTIEQAFHFSVKFLINLSSLTL